MVVFPGELKELRNIKNPMVLFCGAGLSLGAVPGASGLYEDEHNKVEHYLGIDESIDHTKFGGATIQSFLNLKLINEMIVTRAPILLGEGKPLFGKLYKNIKLEDAKAAAYPNDFIQVQYKVNYL